MLHSPVHLQLSHLKTIKPPLTDLIYLKLFFFLIKLFVVQFFTESGLVDQNTYNILKVKWTWNFFGHICCCFFFFWQTGIWTVVAWLEIVIRLALFKQPTQTSVLPTWYRTARLARSAGPTGILRIKDQPRTLAMPFCPGLVRIVKQKKWPSGHDHKTLYK